MDIEAQISNDRRKDYNTNDSSIGDAPTARNKDYKNNDSLIGDAPTARNKDYKDNDSLIGDAPTARNFDFVADEFVKKLIMLFTFEKMEIPLTDTSIDAIISANPSWMTYMDCKEVLFQLQESKFIYRASHDNDVVFGITQDGRMALSNFYTKIPASIREEATNFAKANRQKFKRNQEYTYDYFKNSDGTYTVALRIKDGAANDYMLEIRVKAATRASAVRAAAQWKEKAPSIYEYIHNTVLETEN